MTVLPAAAAAAYQALSKIGTTTATGAATGSAPAASAGNAANFGNFLSDAIKGGIGTMKQGEAAAMQQAAGKANIVDVVNAVNNAELTLDTVVAVRDKVIAAYQTIMQMPI
jgi:flagellar hook-basal body complex protein FliE